MTSQEGPITALLVDDSAVNRRAIAEMLVDSPDVQIVGRAADGEEALRLAMALRPDVITLDLEMPRMDGFTFLRILMATAPTPVIVVSSYAHRADVFKALELGAFDFIAKPGRVPAQVDRVRQELIAKIQAVRLLRNQRRIASPSTGGQRPLPRAAGGARWHVLAVGASTGGPPAIQRLLESMAGQPVAVLIAQHMPPGFTRAFADRLDRIGSFSVKEAQSGDHPQPGTALIAPGGRHLELVSRAGELQVRCDPPREDEKHAPSVDRLFASVAHTLGHRSVGVVLTGMGSDGARGTQMIHAAGGRVWAEGAETAVIHGMPQEAIATGGVFQVLPLHRIGPSILDALGRRS